MDVREKVREMIRAEVARQHPVEDARHTLELIAETAIRFTEDGDATTFHVIDDEGQPRTVLRDGQAVDFTVQDLVAELRGKHPSLFRADPAETPHESLARPEPDASGARDAETFAPAFGAAMPAPSEPQPVEAGRRDVGEPALVRAPRRDWLMVAAGLPEPQGSGILEAERDATARPSPPHLVPAARQPAASAWRDGDESVGTASAPAAKEPGLPRADAGPLVRTPVPLAAVEGTEPLSRPTATPAAPLGSTSPSRAPGRSRVPARRAAAAAAVLLSVMAGYWAFAPGEDPPVKRVQAERPETVALNRADPTSTGTVPAEVAEPTPPKPAVSPPGPVSGVAEVIDTATLRVDGRIVRLFGVEWARGGRPEDLTGYLAGREVTCEPADANEVYRCKVDGRDLSQVVLYNGGGRAADDAPPELVAAQDRARTERVGIWQR